LFRGPVLAILPQPTLLLLFIHSFSKTTAVLYIPYLHRLFLHIFRCILITHAHLDHVNSLIISAGSLNGQRKRIFATEQTLRDLETVFADRIWPNLASWNENDDSFKYLYTP